MQGFNTLFYLSNRLNEWGICEGLPSILFITSPSRLKITKTKNVEFGGEFQENISFITTQVDAQNGGVVSQALRRIGGQSLCTGREQLQSNYSLSERRVSPVLWPRVCFNRGWITSDTYTGRTPPSPRCRVIRPRTTVFYTSFNAPIRLRSIAKTSHNTARSYSTFNFL